MATIATMQFDSDDDDDEFEDLEGDGKKPKKAKKQIGPRKKRRLEEMRAAGWDIPDDVMDKEGDEEEAVIKAIKESKRDKLFQQMQVESLLEARHAPTVKPNDFMLEFQRRQPKPEGKRNTKISELNHYVSLINNTVPSSEGALPPTRAVCKRLKGMTRSQTLDGAEEIVKKALGAVAEAGTLTVEKKVRFAGEEVTIKQTLKAGTREMQQYMRSRGMQQKKEVGGKFSDLDNLIKQLEQPSTVNTMQKTEVEWQTFKEQNKLDEELKKAKKDSYLSKQAFLLRADWRQHEADQRRKPPPGPGASSSSSAAT